MSTRIRGDKLPPALRRQVLAQYVHRWTVENARQSYGGECPGCVQTLGRGATVGDTRKTLGGVEQRVWTREEWHTCHTKLTTDA